MRCSAAPVTAVRGDNRLEQTLSNSPVETTDTPYPSTGDQCTPKPKPGATRLRPPSVVPDGGG